MKDKQTSIKRKRPPIGIKWKMFAILICFVMVFFIVIWLFQVRMLNFFYQGARFNELEDSANTIAQVLDDGVRLPEAADQYADEYYSDIWIYKIVNGAIDTNRPMLYASGIGDSLGPFLETRFDRLYSNALGNEGVYIAVLSMKNFKESYFDFNVISDNMGDAQGFPFVADSMSDMTVIYSSIHQSGDNEYLIVQRSNISPVGTMIRTLENQVLFIGTALILFAFALAIIMSKFITKPIVQINESAKNLAAGRYNIEFSGHGYREIEELSTTLNYAATELSKNDELQKELIANISHDLRTPLTMIKGYGEVMRDIPGENTPENVQVVIDEATRLSELVNDMFDLSKIQSGSRQPDLKIFCLTESIKDTLFRYEKLTLRDGYNIEFQYEGDEWVYADDGMILQVLYNLINNAVNYCGEDKYIGVAQSVSGDTVRITITDHGDGIAEADIPFIWDRYYKVDKVHKRATVGTGLGLSIVKGILELHGATYGVTSTPGSGSAFWFELKTIDSNENIYIAETVD